MKALDSNLTMWNFTKKKEVDKKIGKQELQEF